MQRIVGRGGELERGRQLLGQSLPGWVVLEGESGAGKSTLWRALGRAAEELGATVLRARAAASETQISFAVIADLLDSIDDELLARLPAPQRHALEVACLRVDPTPQGIDLRAVGTGLVSLLRHLTARNPVVLAVDDLRWIDEASGQALAFALHRLGTEPVGVLATRRSDGADTSSGESQPLAAVLAESDRTALISLAALSPVELGQIVQGRLGVALTTNQQEQLQRLTRGNPLHAIELIRALGALDVDRDLSLARAGADIAEVIRRRIAALPSQTRASLATLAALDDQTAEALERVFGDEAVAALEPAMEAGIVVARGVAVQFDHPLLAAAAYATASPEERALMHRRIAGATEDAEVRARHLALGNADPDESVAAQVEVGARRAFLRGAPYAAAQLGDAAIRLTPVGVNTFARRLAAADYYMRAGRLPVAAGRLESLIEELPPGQARARALILLGQARLQGEAFVDGMAALEQALLESGGDHALRVGASIPLAFVLMNVNRVAEAHRIAIDARSSAIALGAPPLIAVATSVEQLAALLIGLRVDEVALDEAVALEDPALPWPALFRAAVVAALAYTWLGKIERARQTFDRILAELEATGDEYSAPAIRGYATYAALHAGDVPAARTHADRCAESALRFGTPSLLAQADAALARVALTEGRLEDLERHTRDLEERATVAGWTAGRLWAKGLAGSGYFAAGQTSRAAEVLGDALAGWTAAGFDGLISHDFLSDLIESLVETDELTAASSLVARVTDQGVRLSLPWLLGVGERGRAALESRRANLKEAISHADAALVHLGEIDERPIEIARTLLLKGRIERRAKRRADARVSLETARSLFARCGAQLWVERSSSEIERLGAIHERVLTETEEQVARLAARGLTNREVAARAFVTPKSVEGILSRVYGKLGIRSRAELGAWAASEITERSNAAAEGAMNTAD